MVLKKSSEPIKISAEIEIEASCAAVYAALDLRCPDNRYLRRGFTLTPHKVVPGDFVMTMPNLPHLIFNMHEHLAKPYERYDIHCHFPTGKPVGILTGDHSSYRLTPLPNGYCHLICHVAFHTIPLSKKGVEKHAAMLFVSLNDDLARLKAMVEEGAEAAETAGALDAFFDEIEGANCTAP